MNELLIWVVAILAIINVVQYVMGTALWTQAEAWRAENAKSTASIESLDRRILIAQQQIDSGAAVNLKLYQQLTDARGENRKLTERLDNIAHQAKYGIESPSAIAALMDAAYPKNSPLANLVANPAKAICPQPVAECARPAPITRDLLDKLGFKLKFVSCGVSEFERTLCDALRLKVVLYHTSGRVVVGVTPEVHAIRKVGTLSFLNMPAEHLRLICSLFPAPATDA